MWPESKTSIKKYSLNMTALNKDLHGVIETPTDNSEDKETETESVLSQLWRCLSLHY
jgi:hypothetical protein